MSTSSFSTRPAGPVPWIEDRESPSSLAIRLTAGEAKETALGGEEEPERGDEEAEGGDEEAERGEEEAERGE